MGDRGIYPKRWLSCFKAGHRKAAREFIDEELAVRLLKRVRESNFTDKEAMDALDFLHKMNSEYYKNVIKKGDRKALHRTKKLRLDCYARENARNRDVMSIQRERVHPLVEHLYRSECIDDDGVEPDFSPEMPMSHEDTIIEMLDGKKLAETPEDVEN